MPTNNGRMAVRVYGERDRGEAFYSQHAWVACLWADCDDVYRGSERVHMRAHARPQYARTHGHNAHVGVYPRLRVCVRARARARPCSMCVHARARTHTIHTRARAHLRVCGCV